MIKYVFFDFDGTISDARGSAVKSLVKVLDEYGYEFSRNEILKLIGDKLHIVLKSLGIDAEHLDEVRDKFWNYFKKEASQGKIKTCVSLKPLWNLKKDYPLIVISNSKTSFINASIKTLGIKSLFSKIYGTDKFGTKDEVLEKLFRKYKIHPHEAVYIGDRFSDIEYAREAGCYAIAIHNKCSWSDLKTIKKEKPDYVIKNFKTLGKILKGIKS